MVQFLFFGCMSKWLPLTQRPSPQDQLLIQLLKKNKKSPSMNCFLDQLCPSRFCFYKSLASTSLMDIFFLKCLVRDTQRDIFISWQNTDFTCLPSHYYLMKCNQRKRRMWFCLTVYMFVMLWRMKDEHHQHPRWTYKSVHCICFVSVRNCFALANPDAAPHGSTY